MSQVSKCTGYKKDDTKYTRNAQLNSDFCWKHQTQSEEKSENNSVLIPDLQDTGYSYLTLEEILTSFKDDLTLRDRLVEHYYLNLSSIEESSN